MATRHGSFRTELSIDPLNCGEKQLLGGIFLIFLDVFMLFPLDSLFVFLEIGLLKALVLLPWNRISGVPTPAAHPPSPGLGWPDQAPRLASTFYEVSP